MSWDGGRSGSGAMIVGFHDGNRIVRVSPDNGSPADYQWTTTGIPLILKKSGLPLEFR